MTRRYHCHYCGRRGTRSVGHVYIAVRGTEHRYHRVVCNQHEERAKEDAAAWRRDMEREDCRDNGGVA